MTFWRDLSCKQHSHVPRQELQILSLYQFTVSAALQSRPPQLLRTDMASGDCGDNLQTWLNKATDPTNEADRWDCIQGFYELVNSQPDGPQIATRLLAHKIQSPQEQEALQALTLLEACMNNCGKRFHEEAGKFRFLNELIKVLSPKYLGVWSPVQVKQRVTEVLYSWTLWLKDEPKIQEAYHMLKKQGVVKRDPKLSNNIIMPPPRTRPEASMFDDEDKAKMLTRLLKSSCPEDLQTANRLIKNTIKEEQEKVEREACRIRTLQEVESSTAQLTLLLNQHSKFMPNRQDTQEMKALYERCDKLRPNLFRLASDTVDNDEALGAILQANDKLTQVLTSYRDVVHQPDLHDNVPASPSKIKSYHLIDLSTLEPPSHATPSPALDTSSFGWESQLTCSSYSEELIQLEDSGRTDGKNISMETYRVCEGDSISQKSSTVPEIAKLGSQLDLSPPLFQPTMNPEIPSKPHPLTLNQSLEDITVTLDSIKPSLIEPITLLDHCGIRVSLHFCQQPLASRPDLAIFIISTVNTSALPVRDIQFQAAVPKTMSVRLQPPSGNDLPAYNPILPPAALSQILLLSNPDRHPVRLRYKLMLTQGAEPINHPGETDRFPEWNSWNNL